MFSLWNRRSCEMYFSKSKHGHSLKLPWTFISVSPCREVWISDLISCLFYGWWLTPKFTTSQRAESTWEILSHIWDICMSPFPSQTQGTCQNCKSRDQGRLQRKCLLGMTGFLYSGAHDGCCLNKAKPVSVLVWGRRSSWVHTPNWRAILGEREPVCFKGLTHSRLPILWRPCTHEYKGRGTKLKE